MYYAYESPNKARNTRTYVCLQACMYVRVCVCNRGITVV